MNRGDWDEPITFATEKHGAYLTISSSAEAARVLLDHWPIAKGKALKRAKSACAMVLMGRSEPEVARIALIEAAREANVLIR